MVVLRINGLNGTVEMIRDRQGAPHCYAEGEHDAFIARAERVGTCWLAPERSRSSV